MLNETRIAGQSNSSASTNFLAPTKWGTWKMRLYTRVAGSGQAGTKRKGWHIRCCRACQSPAFQAYWALGSEDLSGSKIYLCIKTPTAPTVLTTLPPSPPWVSLPCWPTVGLIPYPTASWQKGKGTRHVTTQILKLLWQSQNLAVCIWTHWVRCNPCSLYLDTLNSL